MGLQAFWHTVCWAEKEGVTQAITFLFFVFFLSLDDTDGKDIAGLGFSHFLPANYFAGMQILAWGHRVRWNECAVTSSWLRGTL